MTGDTPFHDLADFVALPRVTALRLAPDGTWLAAAVQTLSADAKKYLTSIWRIDTQGGPARRLTRSAEGEDSPRFLPGGSLLFTFWDHDLGPDQPRLFAVGPDPGTGTEGDDGTERAAKKSARLRDLTPEPGRALDEQAFELTRPVLSAST